jgi:hypothetical protein
MKTEKSHRFLGIFLLALLLSSGLSLSLNVSPVKAADSNTLISESFESWNSNGWTTHSGGGSDASPFAHQGTHSRYFWGTAGGATTQWCHIDKDSTNEHEIMTGWFYRQAGYTPSTDLYGGVSIIGLVSYYSDAIQYGSQVGYYTYNGQVVFYMRVYTGNWENTYYPIINVSVPLNTWTKITICNYYNPTNGYSKIYMGGALIGSVTGNFGSATGQRRLMIGITTASVNFLNAPYWLDDVLAGGLYVSADLEPDDTGPDWVFTEWRYYTFSVDIPVGMYSEDLDHVYLGFTEILTSNGTVGFAAWSNSTGWDSSTNMLYETRDLEPIRVKTGSWSSDAERTIVTFPLWFTKSCLDIWLEEDAVDALIWFNDTTGYESGWITASANMFRIYTDGGFSRAAEYTGDAGVLPGGRDFNMFAYNDSYAFKDLYWRDLQHIKMVPEIQFRAGYQYFQLNWGVDYVLKDGSYQPGLHLQLEPDAVSYTGVFASNVWINYTASWYANNTLIKSEDLYSFYHGEVYKAGDYGRVKFFIDFWFDSGNASTLQGGRINAYEFPMQDSSALWFRWLSSSWGIKDDVIKQSECMVPIIKYGVAEGINSEDIEFVRVWSALAVPADEYNQYVAVINYDTFDTTLSPEPTLKGIFTPPWDETKMPVVANTGVLGAVWSMFAGIGRWLADNLLFGGLSLWPMFVAFLDSVASTMGFPNAFSNFLAWLGTAWTWLAASFGYAFTLIADLFLFLGAVIVSILTVLAEAIVSFVNALSMISSFLTGGIAGAANLWDTFGISTWITIGIIFYPLYLVILWDQKGMDAVIQQLTWIAGIVLWLKDLFITIIRFVLDILGRIIESIPVVE